MNFDEVCPTTVAEELAKRSKFTADGTACMILDI